MCVLIKKYVRVRACAYGYVQMRYMYIHMYVFFN